MLIKIYTLELMEEPVQNVPDEPTYPSPEQLRVADVTDFLTFCDRISTGYDSGYYWEDVQRALRIAAGIEKWPA